MSAVSPSSSPVSHAYDALFSDIGRTAQLPPALFKAICVGESRLDPSAVNGSAVGLGQITPGALQSFNKAMKTSYTMGDMRDPALNLHVAAYVLTVAVKSLSSVLKPDWSSALWIALVCLGYTAGYSLQQGVAALVRDLQARGASVTLDAVLQEAQRRFPKSALWVAPGLADGSGFGPYMSDPNLRAAIHREVANYTVFVQEGMVLPRGTEAIVPVTVIDPPASTAWDIIGALAGVLGLLLAWSEHTARRRVRVG